MGQLMLAYWGGRASCHAMSCFAQASHPSVVPGLPWLCLLEAASSQEKDQLLKLINSREPAGLGNPLVASLAEKYDLAGQVGQRIKERAASARQALHKVGGRFNPAKLEVFIDFIITEFAKVARSEEK